MASPIEQIATHIAQQFQQLNAHIRNMGDEAERAINGYYTEAKRAVNAFDQMRGLRYRPASIQLSAEIVGAGTAASGSADFRVAQNEDFLVYGVRGFLTLNELEAEPGGGAFANALTTTLTPTEILAAKAANCRVTLLNKDTKVPFFENEGISLASICPEAGGQEMRFGPDMVPAFIIPHNMTVQVQFALQSSNLFFNTASSNYGVALTGVYMSREVR